MSNSYFRFKQFTVNQSRCAMKVGTDGVLLGAWACVQQSLRILDVGCGTGLVALMAAQRSPVAMITGIEIDAEAAREATANIAASPWAERMEILCADYRKALFLNYFDAILCNPPYFINSLKPADVSRSLARHSDALDAHAFFLQSAALLSTDGRISVVLPAEQYAEWVGEALLCGLHLCRQTTVYAKPGGRAKRLLLEFDFTDRPLDETQLVIEEAPMRYSADFTRLMKDFYLKL